MFGQDFLIYKTNTIDTHHFDCLKLKKKKEQHDHLTTIFMNLVDCTNLFYRIF